MIFTKAIQFLLYHPTSKDFDRQSGFSLLRKMVVISGDSRTMGSDRGNISYLGCMFKHRLITLLVYFALRRAS